MGGANWEKTEVLLILICMFGMAIGNRNLINWNYHIPLKTHNSTQTRKIIVGDSKGWHFGYNYTSWVLKNGPFYLGDILVFKYNPPNTTTFPHSVYLLPNSGSFMSCNQSYAKKIADVNQGAGDGFEFILKKGKPHYFACGEHNGFHCNNGTMKFQIVPLISM